MHYIHIVLYKLSKSEEQIILIQFPHMICMLVCTHMCIHACGGHKSMLVVHHNYFSPYSLRQDLSLNLEFVDSARLASKCGEPFVSITSALESQHACHHTWPLSKTGTGIESRSSCLFSKSPTIWGISPALCFHSPSYLMGYPQLPRMLMLKALMCVEESLPLNGPMIKLNILALW